MFYIAHWKTGKASGTVEGIECPGGKATAKAEAKRILSLRYNMDVRGMDIEIEKIGRKYDRNKNSEGA